MLFIQTIVQFFWKWSFSFGTTFANFIPMKQFIYILSLALLFSCGSSKNVGNADSKKDKKEFDIELSVQYRKPYCGGARPTPEQERGFLMPYQNKEIALKIGTSNADSVKVYKKITTDEKGNVSIKLPAGTYAVVLPHKLVPYEEFKKNELEKFNGKQLKLYKEDCLIEFWKNADATIEVKESGSIQIEMRNTCYSGFNYCMQYTGPLPP